MKSVQDRSLEQAVGGYVSEMDHWMTMIRHFCDNKLADDPDWIILNKILEVLNIGQIRNIPPEKIFGIIEFNRKKS